MNHGSKKIVRHEALRRPLPKGRCDTQAFRIIQPGKARPQVFDQKALDRVETEKHQPPHLFHAQEDDRPPQEGRSGAQAGDPCEAGGEDDSQAGRTPGRGSWREGSRRGWSHHVPLLACSAEVRGEPVAHLGKHGIASVINGDDVPGAVGEDELLLTGAKPSHQTPGDSRADAVVLP